MGPARAGSRATASAAAFWGERMKRSFALAAAAVAALLASTASAEEFTVRGVGSSSIKGVKPETVRAMATQEAKRRAVIAAIDRMLGAGASSRPEVAQKVDAIVEQVPDRAVEDTSSQAVGNQFEVSVSLALDDKTFRELLSDQGVALSTNAARSSSILAIMDEYRTTPKDLRAPVEQLVEFNSQTGGAYSDTSASGSSSRAAAAHASSAKYSVNAREASSASAVATIAITRQEELQVTTERSDLTPAPGGMRRRIMRTVLRCGQAARPLPPRRVRTPRRHIRR